MQVSRLLMVSNQVSSERNPSGCITSAESVLITLQSHNEVLTFLNTNPPPSSPDHKFPVISIAPQILASLAARVSSTSRAQVSVLQILRRIQVFCTDVLGFRRVYDTTFARHLALLDHTHEFLERRRGQGEGKLPMLASACPGWICYTEKTHAEMLPFISRGKSPQQIMGTLVKTWLGSKWGKQWVLTSHSDSPCSNLSLSDPIRYTTLLLCRVMIRNWRPLAKISTTKYTRRGMLTV